MAQRAVPATAGSAWSVPGGAAVVAAVERPLQRGGGLPGTLAEAGRGVRVETAPAARLSRGAQDSGVPGGDAEGAAV